MRMNKTRIFIVCTAAAVLLALVTALFAAIGFTGPVRSVLKTVAKPFEWCGTQVANSVNGFVSVFADYDRLVEENEALRREVAELKEEKQESAVLREENAWLKEYLQMAGEHADLQLCEARVIARATDNYSTVLTLNRGAAHGVKVNMPVLTSDGVFGYVKEAGLDWCKVVSLLETVSSIGAYTDRTGALGVVQGDVSLRGEGLCLMTYIDKNADLRIGDRVYTSGGPESNYPPDLLIGEIVSIEANDSGLVVEIKPAADALRVDLISRLMIVCGYASEG